MLVVNNSQVSNGCELRTRVYSFAEILIGTWGMFSLQTERSNPSVYCIITQTNGF
jgi:hypothetical protein